MQMYDFCAMAGPSPKGVAEHYEGHEDVAGGGHEGDEREGRRRAAEEKDQKGGLREGEPFP